MRQRDLQTRELEDDSREYVAQPRPPTNRRRPAVASVIAALLVMTLGVATFATISAYRTAKGAMSASATHTPLTPLWSTTATSPLQEPRRGVGLPKGVEITAFTLTGTDEGWGTGCVITDRVAGFPDRCMVFHYSAGAWAQVGPALPGERLSGIDMLSSSEGWVIGCDDASTGLLLHISNGAWQKELTPMVVPHAAIGVVAMRAPDEGWAAVANLKAAQGGASTSLYHYSGGVWTLVSTSLQYITDIAPVADGEALVIGWNTGNTQSSLAHIQGGTATVELTSPRNSTFYRLRTFAPNDIWIEGAKHDPLSNLEADDTPLVYHFDGATWSAVNLHASKAVQHAGIVSPNIVWGFAIVEPPPSSQMYRTSYIASIYSNAGGQWKTLGVPYKDLQSLDVVSSSSTDVWAVGAYMVMTKLANNSGYAGVGHSVLLHYTGGSWTEYGR
ncbi:MAG TPA: hypothetical protein VFQ25_11405 [Ktedonobacterales bacterium]|nr:hypothetical protein [Ktedonobacterales bacterium]